jgi:tripartite-type tricarboxylate transporter receptor subunit TctC
VRRCVASTAISVQANITTTHLGAGADIMRPTVPGYEHTSWNGMWAPKGTPREILVRLNESLGKVLKQPEVLERLRSDGREAAHSTPEEFQRVIARDIAKYAKVIQSGNITAH